MTVKEALKKYSSIEIDLLLSHILGKPKEFLFLNDAHELTRKEANELTRMVKRRLAGEPVAYILGYKDFCGLRFKVNKDVLIPRPESEWLVERAAEHLLLFKEEYLAKRGEVVGASAASSNPSVLLRNPPSLKKGRILRVLDLGTGSGCIAISIASRIKGAQVTASDISEKALKVAKQNAKQYHTLLYDIKIKFVKSDLFASVNGKFDVIVANLPYVPMKMLNKYVLNKQLPADSPFAGLKFEPIFALTDGTKSFQIYRRFFEQVGGHTHQQSIILLEIDPSSRKFLTEYQKKYLPSWKIKFYKDFKGLWRFAEVCAKNQS